MDSELKQVLRDQGLDFVKALVILLKEAVFALSVFFVGHGLSWLVHKYSSEGETTSAVVSIISDIGAVVLFVMLVCKDLWDYISKR